MHAVWALPPVGGPSTALTYVFSDCSATWWSVRATGPSLACPVAMQCAVSAWHTCAGEQERTDNVVVNKGTVRRAVHIVAARVGRGWYRRVVQATAIVVAKVDTQRTALQHGGFGTSAAARKPVGTHSQAAPFMQEQKHHRLVLRSSASHLVRVKLKGQARLCSLHLHHCNMWQVVSSAQHSSSRSLLATHKCHACLHCVQAWA
jgi:hypothetical protein